MKYILFDLDDTLLDFHEGERRALLATMKKYRMNPLVEEEIQAFSIINENLFNEFASGKMTREEFRLKRFEVFGEVLHIELPVEEANRNYLNLLKYQANLFEDVQPTLEYLSKKYRLFISSNGSRDIQLKRLELAGILSYFEKVFVSDECGVNKPEVGFFSYCKDHIQDENLEEYLIIGDRLETDIELGNRVGIQSILLDRTGKKKNSIASLLEILSIL